MPEARGPSATTSPAISCPIVNGRCTPRDSSEIRRSPPKSKYPSQIWTSLIENVIVGENAAIHPSCSQAGYILGVHFVVDALRRVIPAPGDAGFEIDDPRLWCCAAQLVESIAPDIGKIGRRRDRTVHPFCQLDITPGGADVGLLETRIAGMRQDLVDAASDHHVAAKKQGEALRHRINVAPPLSDTPTAPRLHAADLEILDGVTQLREAFLQIVGEKR